MGLASKLYNQTSGSETPPEGGSIRYFATSITMLFSMVEPPTAPIASGGRPPISPLVGKTGQSGTTLFGHMLSTGPLPGGMELPQPDRGPKSPIPSPSTRPRLVTPT